VANPIDPATASVLDTPSGENPAVLHGAISHLYRGEMQRMTVWRQRLDITSNWAILLTVALTTFTLGSRDVPHYTLLLGLALIGISALIEGRRYSHLQHSGWRIYLIEAGYYGELLDPSGTSPIADWRRTLAHDLRYPRRAVNWFTATCIRLRRNYLLIQYFVTAAWITKLFIHPVFPVSADEFYGRLAVGQLIPPWFVAITAFAFVAGSATLALRCPSADEFEKWGKGFRNKTDQELVGKQP